MRSWVAGVVIVAAIFGAVPSAARTPVAGAPETHALLAGIPQSGVYLGSGHARVTVIEVADLQCPYCRRFMLTALPGIVHDYVRPGRVRFIFNGVAFLGPQSVPALDAVLAAGVQDRLWNFAELLYHNQGRENSGWVTEDLLRSIARQIAGLDFHRWLADRRSPGIVAARTDAARAAQRLGVPGTPAFFVTRRGRRPIPVLASVAGPLRAAIVRQLRG